MRNAELVADRLVVIFMFVASCVYGMYETETYSLGENLMNLATGFELSESCRFCRRPRSSHLQRTDPSRLRYHEASNPGSYIGRVARTSASRRVLSDSSEAHGQTEIRPPRVEAIPPRP